MSDKAFARAISQIATEDQQWRLAEQQAKRRRHIFARVRKVCLAVVGAALVIVAYAHRLELGQQLARFTNHAEKSESGLAKTESGLAKNVEGIRENAAKRDEVLDEIQK